MGIGASLTLLFVTGFFTTMFWLIARMPGDATQPQPRPEARDSVGA